jgi:hypothetical protein
MACFIPQINTGKPTLNCDRVLRGEPFTQVQASQDNWGQLGTIEDNWGRWCCYQPAGATLANTQSALDEDEHVIWCPVTPT